MQIVVLRFMLQNYFLGAYKSIDKIWLLLYELGTTLIMNVAQI
jgi:hypothetical protein